jgi:hypothetical protein
MKQLIGSDKLFFGEDSDEFRHVAFLSIDSVTSTPGHNSAAFARLTSHRF